RWYSRQAPFYLRVDGRAPASATVTILHVDEGFGLLADAPAVEADVGGDTRSPEPGVRRRGNLEMDLRRAEGRQGYAGQRGRNLPALWADQGDFGVGHVVGRVANLDSELAGFAALQRQLVGADARSKLLDADVDDLFGQQLAVQPLQKNAALLQLLEIVRRHAQRPPV